MIIYEENSKEVIIPMGLGTPSGGAVEQYVGGKNIRINGNVINCTINTSDFVTEDELQEVEDKIPSLDGYATEEIVEEKIENSLTGYATEEYVNQQIIEAGSVTTEIVEEMIDESLVDYYTQTETDAEIDEKVSSALVDYYDKQEVDNLIPDVNNFATKDELQEVENTLKDLDATQVKTNISTEIFDFDNVEVGLEQITQAVESQGEQLYNKVDNINGVSGIWQGTKAQYDALASHSNNTVYILKG